MSARAGGPAHLFVGFILGVGAWAVVGLATLLILGPDALAVLLTALLAVVLGVAVAVGALSAVAATTRRRRGRTLHHWPGRMA